MLSVIVVVIAPADTHARADIFHSGLLSNISKRSVSIVPIEIIAAKVVHYVEVRPAVAVVIIPSAAEAVARVVLVQARLGGHIPESSVAIVTHQEVGRSVLRVVVRRRIFVLIRTLVIKVETEINVEPAIAVIIGDGGAGEGSLRRIAEPKRI